MAFFEVLSESGDTIIKRLLKTYYQTAAHILILIVSYYAGFSEDRFAQEQGQFGPDNSLPDHSAELPLESCLESP